MSPSINASPNDFRRSLNKDFDLRYSIKKKYSKSTLKGDGDKVKDGFIDFQLKSTTEMNHGYVRISG